MAGEINSVVSVEQLLGGELASAAEEILVGARLGAFDPTQAVSLATAVERGGMATAASGARSDTAR